MDVSLHPKLASKARIQTDKITGKPTLLYPEGVMVLNPTGEAILSLCDGDRTISDIATELASRYEIEASELISDVVEYMGRLQDRGVLVLTP